MKINNRILRALFLASALCLTTMALVELASARPRPGMLTPLPA